MDERGDSGDEHLVKILLALVSCRSPEVRLGIQLVKSKCVIAVPYVLIGWSEG